VIKSLRRLWVLSVVVRLDSGNGCVVIKIRFHAVYKYSIDRIDKHLYNTV